MAMSKSAQGRYIRRVAFGYAACATLWIIFSDRLLSHLIDVTQVTGLGTVKGLVFVAVTTGLLVAALRVAPVSIEPTPGGLDRPRVWPMVTVFLTLSAVIGVTGFITFRVESTLARNDALTELEAVARLKVDGVERWLAERRTHGKILAESQTLRADLAAWLRLRDEASYQRLNQLIGDKRRLHGFSSVELRDGRGGFLIGSDAASHDFPDLTAAIAATAASGQPRFLDFYTDPADGLRFGFLVPVRLDNRPESMVVAVLEATLRPQDDLFDYVKQWPLPSTSGEVFLVRQEGGEVVFLSPLRNSPGTPPGLRKPLSMPDLPVARAFRTGNRRIEGIDYRGIPALAAVLPVAGTPWRIVAKIDEAEALAPLRRLALSTGILTVAALLAAALVMAMLWQGHRLRLVMSDLERARALKAAEDEGREMRLAKERAEAADHVKSAFLATMSHELRTPLNSIIGFTGVLLQGLAGPLNEEQTKQLAIVRSAGRHLLALINDVLDISKIEAGQLVMTIEPFDLGTLLDRVLTGFRPQVERKGLTFDVQGAIGALAVVGDVRRVEQVLLNLLSNALKFTDRGCITVECRRDDGFAVLSVTDTGPGIAPEDRERIFLPFVQLASNTDGRLTEGSGLGLSICRRLIEAMNGEIGVGGRPDGGSCFHVTLPLAGGGDACGS